MEATPIPGMLGAFDGLPFRSEPYSPAVSESTLRDMAVEKVSEDTEMFSEFILLECQSPCERVASEFFGPISTRDLIVEVLMKKVASDQQLAQGWKELRNRYLSENEGEISRLMREMRG